MSFASRTARVSVAVFLVGCLMLSHDTHPSLAKRDAAPEHGIGLAVTHASRANALPQRQPGIFEPNLGQWNHAAKFLHRSGQMTLFLEERGWVIDLVKKPHQPEADANDPQFAAAHKAPRKQKTRGVALRMTFEGDRHIPEIVGETKLAGHHDYFLGNDESCWRTEVPLYDSVRYERIYTGIDLRLREANGEPEYDLLLEPGADLSRVIVHVEGATGMSIALDGSLIIDTALGPLTQSLPETWQTSADGTRHDVICNFILLGSNRFGFVAPGWARDTSLTIDPSLIWSTFLPSFGPTALSVDTEGVVTLVGIDNRVIRLDPGKGGGAQLVYSSFLGPGTAYALSVDAGGVVTVAGWTNSSNFPTSTGAYDVTYNGGAHDAFVSRLDPSQTGTAQLVYSTFVGGKDMDGANALSVDAGGVVTVAGWTFSADFPSTRGAYDTTHNGPTGVYGYDAFISRLDPSKTGSAQLVYSTFLGGKSGDTADGLFVDPSGVVSVTGSAGSADFPTTSGAYDTTFHGSPYPPQGDVFVSRLDPSKVGPAQLIYSTFLGGRHWDYSFGISVDASGLMTVAGTTVSSDFPTTRGAHNTTNHHFDAFVSRLDPSQTGSAQLVYSTLLGGRDQDRPFAFSIDADGVVTVAGETTSMDFPTTGNAISRSLQSSHDGFVSRLDPGQIGSAQLVYSTLLGGSDGDGVSALDSDIAGVVTAGGATKSPNFPTTNGAYNTTRGYGFVSRLSMDVAFYADRYELSFGTAGTQKLWLDAGVAHARRSYAIFGSISGTRPGTTLTGIHIPLNIDPYTDITLGSAGPPIFVGFRGILDGKGEATASFNLPSLPPMPSFTLHHAYIVFDNTGKIHMASNAVPLTLK